MIGRPTHLRTNSRFTSRIYSLPVACGVCKGCTFSEGTTVRRVAGDSWVDSGSHCQFTTFRLSLRLRNKPGLFSYRHNHNGDRRGSLGFGARQIDRQKLRTIICLLPFLVRYWTCVSPNSLRPGLRCHLENESSGEFDKPRKRKAHPLDCSLDPSFRKRCGVGSHSRPT